MSELAFNANGETFEVPATVTGWRVRRMKPRGAPELVYGKDGRPLTVGIEADIDELRDAVGSAGKYRLDAINDDGKCVENVPAAYVHVVKPQRTLESGGTLVTTAAGDDAIREAMRLNTELAKSVIDRFPEMMTAAAELLRAADGAGLPARAPREVDEEETEDDEPPAPSSAGFEFINNLVAQVIPIVVSSLAGKKMPKLASVLDWRKASAQGQESGGGAPALPASTTTPETAKDELPALDAKAISHFMAIQSALSPAEATFARQVAAELTPAEMRAWFQELSAMSVGEAVAKIRSIVAAMPKGGAS